MPSDFSSGSGLSDQELELAHFWNRNRLTIRKSGYGALIGICILIWLFVLWTLLDAYAISYPRESRIPLRIFQNQQALLPLFQKGPAPLKPSSVQLFTNTDNRVDALVELENPNEIWWAEFDYVFIVSGKETTTRKGFILPKTRRYLAEPGINANSGRAEIQLKNIAWKRIDPNQVGTDLTSYIESRQLTIKDVNYARNVSIGEKLIGQSTFTVENQTAYGYYDPEWIIILMRSGNPAAITKITTDQISAGESKSFSINWFDQPAGITETLIQPNINILNPASFIAPN